MKKGPRPKETKRLLLLLPQLTRGDKRRDKDTDNDPENAHATAPGPVKQGKTVRGKEEDPDQTNYQMSERKNKSWLKHPDKQGPCHEVQDPE